MPVRHLIALFAVLAVTFLSIHAASYLARLADISDIQAGLVAGTVMTWTLFRLNDLIYGGPPAAESQD